jgi:hypothetical protein
MYVKIRRMLLKFRHSVRLPILLYIAIPHPWHSQFRFHNPDQLKPMVLGQYIARDTELCRPWRYF